MTSRASARRSFGSGVPATWACRAGLIAVFIVAGPGAGWAQDAGFAEEAAQCERAVDDARSLLVQLPASDPSRRFAESDLLTAMTEMAAGEVDECPDLVARARTVIETRPYRLRPGERMHGYGPDSRN